jgi:hypothetical protein
MCCLATVIALLVFLVIIPKLLTGLIKLIVFLIVLGVLILVVLAIFDVISVPDVGSVLLPQLL